LNRQRDGDQVVVVAAADFAWRALALNWAQSLERVGLRCYLIFAADAQAGAHHQCARA
jgi:hypothetical protein